MSYHCLLVVFIVLLSDFSVVVWYLPLLILVSFSSLILLIIVLLIFVLNFSYVYVIILELFFPVLLIILLLQSSTNERVSAVIYLSFYAYLIGYVLLTQNWLGLSSVLLLLLVLANLPVFGLHIWLPNVHAEISLIGSILLASLILKVAYPMYIFIGSLILLFVLLVYSALFMIILNDGNVVVAYSSVLHMTCTIYIPLVIFMLGGLIHIVVSPLMFVVVYVCYVYNSSRFYVNIALFLLFLLNFAFPLLSSFFCEMYLLSYTSIGAFLVICMFTCCIILLVKMMFGSVSLITSFAYMSIGFVVIII